MGLRMGKGRGVQSYDGWDKGSIKGDARGGLWVGQGGNWVWGKEGIGGERGEFGRDKGMMGSAMRGLGGGTRE